MFEIWGVSILENSSCAATTGLRSACSQHAGKKVIRVGLDSKASIRVAGQDDHPLARYTCPPLTTIAQEYEAISSYAVESAGEGRREREKEPHESKLFEGKVDHERLCVS